MTDDERISVIEQWIKTGDLNLPCAYVFSDVKFCLRVIRDQRAELTQARQAITNMRKAIDGN